MKKRLLLGMFVLAATTFAAETTEAPVKEETKTITAEETGDIITTTDSEAVEGLVAGRQTGDGGFSGSYTGEVRTNMYQGGGRSEKVANGNYKNEANNIEWTLGKGKVNVGRVGFIYDVDRDFKYDKDWNKTREGWDTEFALDYQGGTFGMAGKEWTFNPSLSYGYDKAENYTSKAKDPSARDHEYKRLIEFNPKISTTYYGFATDISPIVAYDDITGTTAFELDITNFRRLNNNWSYVGDIYFDFAGTKNGKSVKKGEKDTYSNALFNGNIDEDNKFAFSTEQYLNYEKEIIGNTYFLTEFGLEAYSLLQSQANDVALYVAPELQYRAKLGPIDVVPYIKYTAYSATGGYEAGTDGEIGRDELSTGIRFAAKF